MPQTYVATRRVEFRDTDAAGIMHFSAFFTKMEEAEHEFFRHLGLAIVEHDAEGVITWPRVAAHCEYQGSVKFEDVLAIELHISRLGSKSVTYEFEFLSGGRAIASGQVTTVCCRVESGGGLKSLAIPEKFSSKLQHYIF
jgi:4-hydroxybenzoyl-CoA thioesterase/acyl-CoA thioester hydrolase